MNILIMGPPGAGKGTQAARVANALGLVHLSTGDILRREIREGTPLGVSARSFVDSGSLVPDDIIIEMLSSEMLAALRGKGFLLDGFPRTLAQAERLERAMDSRGLQIHAVLYVRVPDDELLRRLMGRLSCDGCTRVYHATANPPARPGVCDACGGRLAARSDDTVAVIARRLRVYRTQTSPVLAFYESRGLLSEIDGDQPIDAIGSRIDDLLQEVAFR